MKLFRFDSEVGKQIEQFNSQHVHITPIFQLISEQVQVLQIASVVLKENGIIGSHQAGVPQIFMVVEGEGWVSGREKKKVSIKKGELAVWEAGEWHETSTNTGMTAMIIEYDKLELFPFLQEIEWKS